MRRRDVLAGAAAFLASPVPGRADEVGAVAIARQPSLGHLPLMLMEEQGLLQKAAAARGVAGLQARYLTLAGGAAMNDALLSGTIQFAAGGVPPLVLLWSKTEGTAMTLRLSTSSLNSAPSIDVLVMFGLSALRMFSAWTTSGQFWQLCEK